MQSKYLTAMDGMQRQAVQLGQRVQRARQQLLQSHSCSRTKVLACMHPQACAVVHQLGKSASLQRFTALSLAR